MIIPKEIDFLIKKEKRKDAALRIIKVYEALLFKKGDNKNWFDVPSAYLEKVNSRYYKVMNLFLEYGVIEYLSINSEYNFKDLFNYELHKHKYYYPTKSMRYRFLIDITQGYELEFDVPSNLYDGEKWYTKTKYSLLQLGFPQDQIIIKRDNFSRRLHTNITGNVSDFKSYKTLLSGGEYWSIDSKTSQPRLFWMTLKDIELQDEEMNRIFENGLDFYDVLIQKIPAVKDRRDAKELFTSWVNGTGYLAQEKASIRDIFPVATMFIKNYKSKSYKDVCRLLQIKEAKIFIDDLLNNCPVDFCLTVHDSLIIKKEDVELVLEYCNNKYNDLIFVASEVNDI